MIHKSVSLSEKNQSSELRTAINESDLHQVVTHSIVFTLDGKDSVVAAVKDRFQLLDRETKPSFNTFASEGDLLLTHRK